jgi:hypothetical protein
MKKLLSLLVILLSFCACRKAQTIEVNPHANVRAIDCRNLIVRSVVLSSDKEITVDVENTCINCDEAVYSAVLMINRNTKDTLGVSPCYTCTSTPKNRTVEKYVLDRFSSSINLSKMENFRFEMLGICRDMTYLPK